jgi:phage terminase large subunit-like protein
LALSFRGLMQLSRRIGRSLHTNKHVGHSALASSKRCRRVEPKGDAIIITKQPSRTAKIDPLMAACTVALAGMNPRHTTRSYR